MAGFLADRVLDNGLSVLDSEADRVYLCSQAPANFTEATSTYDLGLKNWGTGNVFGAPAAGTPNGREVAAVAITDGSITDDGTATHEAVVDFANSRLLAVVEISNDQVVSNGNTFSRAAYDITIPNAA